jgi:hypothetical protein
MTTTEAPEIRPETLTFILEYTKGAPQIQLANADALDAKAMQILAAAGVTLGFVGLSNLQPGGKAAAIVVLLAALVFFVATAATVLLQLGPKTFRQSQAADQLWPKHWHEDVATIEHALVQDIAAAYEHNRPLLDSKATSVRLALLFLSLEAVCVVAAVVVTRIL